MSRTSSPKLLQDVAPDFSYSVACLASDGLAYKCLLTPKGWTNWASEAYSKVLYPQASESTADGPPDGKPEVHPKSLVLAYVWADIREDCDDLTIAKEKIDIVLSCPVVHGMEEICTRQEELEAKKKTQTGGEFSNVNLSHIFLCVDISCANEDLKRNADGADALASNKGLQSSCKITKYIEEKYPQLGGLYVAAHDHPCARLALDSGIQIVDMMTAKTMRGSFGHLGLVSFFDDLRYGNHEDAIEGVVQYLCHEDDPEEWTNKQWDSWAGSKWKSATGVESIQSKTSTDSKSSFTWAIVLVVLFGILYQLYLSPESQKGLQEAMLSTFEELQRLVLPKSNQDE